MLETTLKSLHAGIEVSGCIMNLHRTTQGRFREEQNLELHYQYDGKEYYLLHAKDFLGGNQKLQGETAFDEESKKRHLRLTTREVESFLQSHASLDNTDEYSRRALHRSDRIASRPEETSHSS
jgi:hypothetical protein